MADLNAKAPKVRSGDEINPVLASIIKISALIVSAALIVLVTIIIVKTVQNRRVNENIFKDKQYVELGDFKILISNNEDNLDTYEDIIDSDLKDLIINAYDNTNVDEENHFEISFFFYYGSKSKSLEKNHKEIVDYILNLDENYQLLLVDLDKFDVNGDDGLTNEFKDYLKKHKDLDNYEEAPHNDIKTVLENEDNKFDAFVINYNSTNTDLDNRFEIVKGYEEVQTYLSNLGK